MYAKFYFMDSSCRGDVCCIVNVGENEPKMAKKGKITSISRQLSVWHAACMYPYRQKLHT